MKRSRQIIFMGVLLFLLLAGACVLLILTVQKFPDTSVVHPQQTVQARDKVPELDSPYTFGTKNKDGSYELYLFSAPVQYRTGQGFRIIQNRLEPGENGQGFKVSGNPIEMRFPQTLEGDFTIVKSGEEVKFRAMEAAGYQGGQKRTYKNQYGDTVEAVVYESPAADLAFYPVNTGVKCELVCKKSAKQLSVKFRLEYPGGILREESASAFLFAKDNPVDVVYYPFHGISGSAVTNPDPDVVMSGRDTFEITTVCAPAKGDKMECSFEFYQNKIPDCTVYSKADSHYLSEIAIVGDEPKTGTGYHFLRFRFRYLLDMPAQNLVEATLCLKRLGGGGGSSPLLYQAYGQWTSTQMEWEKKYVFETLLAKGKARSGMLQFDITKFAQDCLDDDSMFAESQGAVMKNDRAGFQALATNDSAMYIPYVRMKLKALPEKLRVLENINPQDNE